MSPRSFQPALPCPPEADHAPCPCRALIEERMAPDPKAVLAAFLDLDVTETEIARYFGIPQACIESYLAA
ncbi:hypothetical protein [Acidimangrovimonas pyrenivorans]|uniref:Uncharacterized protein n=1 Tax=Acidimangrovimonas pyrenivorans TaxID=2030798 RepID=A0ABV7AND8_9RHOB